MLEVANLTVGYNSNDTLIAVSLAAKLGIITTIIGSNGAGKTTMLRAISALLSPRSGEIRFMGERIDGLTPAQIVSKGISQVPEGRELFARMSVYDNLMVGAFLRKDKSQVKRDLDKVYAYFPVLEKRSGSHAKNLSGGEQQMLAFGRAMMSGPKMLILDEPSVGLAPLVEQHLMQTVRKLAEEEGLGVLLVEQNASLALSLSISGYVLEFGKVVAFGSASDLKDDPAVRAAYLGL